MLVLRVYRIQRPVTVRVRPEYEGCKSWVEIDRDLPFEGTPVIADEEFERAAAGIEAVVREAGVARRRSVGRLNQAHRSLARDSSRGARPRAGARHRRRRRRRRARSRPRALCRRLGTHVVMGGVTWERLPIDPRPGPRSAAEIVGARRARARACCSPGPTRAPTDGAVFAESRMAGLLGEQTVLVDLGTGPGARSPRASRSAAPSSDVDLVVFVDVGGDVLGPAPSRGSRARCATRSCWPPAALLQQRGVARGRAPSSARAATVS